MLLLLLTFLIVFSPLALGFGLAVSLRPLHDERQRRLAQAKEMRETPRVSEPVETSTEEPENPQEVEAEPAAEIAAEVPVAESSPETSLEPSLPAPESENAPPTAPTVSQEREPNALEKAIEEVGREILKEEDVEAPAPKDAPKNIEEPAAEPVSTAPFDPNEILSNMISGEGEDVEAQPGEPGIDLGQNDVELPKGEEVDADMLQQLMNRLGTTPVASHVPHEVSETTDNAVEDASVQTEPPASSTENPSEDAVAEPSGELEIEPDDPTTTAVPLVNEILGEDFNVDSLVGPSKEVETPKADETEFVENTEPTGIASNAETTALEGFAEKVANEEKPAEKRSDDTVQCPTEQSELGILETDVLGREGVVAFVATEPETAASYRVVQDALGESPTGLTEFREIAQEPLPGGTTTVFSASMLRLRRKKPPTKEG